jgi:Protein of unknown function (DUF2637)
MKTVSVPVMAAQSKERKATKTVTLHEVFKSRPASYWVTVAAVVTVAFVAAVISYSHITDIAMAAGEQWRAYLIPWTFDGVVLAASMTMMVRRAMKLRYGWLPLTALAFGVLGSVAANVANAVVRPETVLGNHGIAIMIGGFTPLAFLAGFHMLLGQRALFGNGGQVVEEPSPLSAQPGDIGIAGISDQGDVNLVSPGRGKPAIQGTVEAPPIPLPGQTGPLPRWSSVRTDRSGLTLAQVGGAVDLSGLLEGQPRRAVGNGTQPPGVSGTLLATLPPLAELQVSPGQPVNGHDVAPPPDQSGPAGGESLWRPAVAATPASDRQPQPEPSARPESSPAGTPGDPNAYLDDELYVLAAEHGLSLDEVARASRRVNGSRRSENSAQPRTADQSLPQPRQSSDGKPRSQVSDDVARPTPTTPPPRTPSPGVPATQQGPVPGDSSTPTNASILDYLDTHPEITVRQAAISLGVSESTVYRAKRTRSQSVKSS